jgi:hypothetical protein
MKKNMTEYKSLIDHINSKVKFTKEEAEQFIAAIKLVRVNKR